jgi:tetratricopeptide (TPR) repeat protein
MGALGLRADTGAVLQGLAIVKEWFSGDVHLVTRDVLETAIDRYGLRLTGPARGSLVTTTLVSTTYGAQVRQIVARLTELRIVERVGTAQRVRESRTMRTLRSHTVAGRPRAAIRAVATTLRTGRVTVSRQLAYQIWATLGIALRQMGRNREALPLLEEAVELLPERPQALGNLAACLASLGKPEEAERFATKSIALSNETDTAWVVMAHCALLRNDVKAARVAHRKIRDPESRLDVAADMAMRNGPVALGRVLSRGARHVGTPRAVVAFARDLVVRSKETGQGMMPWMPAGAAHRKRALKALSLLENAERDLIANGSEDGLAECLILKGALRGFAFRQRADDEFARAGSIAVGNPDLSRKVAQYWIEQGAFEKALQVLGTPDARAEVESWESQYARALLTGGRYEELLRVIDPSTADASTRDELASLRAGAYIALGRYEEALADLSDIDVGGANAQVAISRARAQRGIGDKVTAYATLDSAIERAEPGEQWRLATIKAGMYLEDAEWANALALYERWYSPSAIGGFVGGYLTALYNVDRMGTCVTRGRELIAQQGPSGDLYPWLEALVQLGYTKEAIMSARRVAKAEPENAFVRCIIGEASLREGRAEEAVAALPSVADAARLSVEAAEKAAEVLFLGGSTAAALRLAFLVLQRHPESRKARILMFKIALNAEGREPAAVSPDVAGPGTVIKLGNGESSEIVTIVPEGARAVSSGELVATSAAATDLIGRTKGASVTRSGRKGVWTIDSIESVYAVAARGVRDALADERGTEKVIEKVAIEDAVKLMESQARALEAERVAAVDSYQTYGPPMSALSRKRDRTSVDVWYALVTGQLGQKVDVAGQTPREEPSLLETALHADTIVLDATAILALMEWGVLEYAEKMKWRLCVAHSTIGDLEEARVEHLLGTRVAGQVYLADGRLTYGAVNQERVRVAENMFGAALVWLRKHCEVCPTPLEFADGRREGSRPLGLATWDTVGVANKLKAIVATEDRALRRFAQGMGARGGTMALAMVDAMAQSGAISKEKSSEARAIAIRWGYETIAVDAKVVVAAMKLDKGVGGTVRAVIARLAGSSVSDPEAVAVCVDLLLEIERNEGLLDRDGCVAEVVAGLSKRHRGKQLWAEVSTVVRRSGGVWLKSLLG